MVAALLAGKKKLLSSFSMIVRKKSLPSSGINFPNESKEDFLLMNDWIQRTL